MSDFKEFQGKTLDAAIAEACAYYDAPREKLEIDIIEDAKSGIFGLVGARKARVRARRAQFPTLSGRGKGRRAEAEAASAEEPETQANTDAPRTDTSDERRDEATAETADEPRTTSSRKGRRAGKPVWSRHDAEEAEAESSTRNSAGDNTPAGNAQESASEEEDSPSCQTRRGRPSRSGGKGTDNPTKTEKAEKSPEKSEDAEGEGGLPRIPLSELDQERLLRVSTDMVSALVFPIVGEVPLDMSVSDDRVQVRVDCEDTGLLIGREGQNLAAVQYLAARMITHAMGAQVRVQVDAGDYHFRQDSRLQELAHSLADKVRATGRPQSTRPLSAYQRRVIHLALQDDPDVQTCSSGEGALKRVVILRRKD